MSETAQNIAGVALELEIPSVVIQSRSAVGKVTWNLVLTRTSGMFRLHQKLESKKISLCLIALYGERAKVSMRGRIQKSVTIEGRGFRDGLR